MASETTGITGAAGLRIVRVFRHRLEYCEASFWVMELEDGSFILPDQPDVDLADLQRIASLSMLV